MSAAAFVIAGMKACLPEGVPLSFEIAGARWLRSGKNRHAQADVVMFDGKPAKLECWAWAGGAGYAHMWTDMPGGDASFEGGRWLRVEREACPS